MSNKKILPASAFEPLPNLLYRAWMVIQRAQPPPKKDNVVMNDQRDLIRVAKGKNKVSARSRFINLAFEGSEEDLQEVPLMQIGKDTTVGQFLNANKDICSRCYS